MIQGPSAIKQEIIIPTILIIMGTTINQNHHFLNIDLVTPSLRRESTSLSLRQNNHIAPPIKKNMGIKTIYINESPPILFYILYQIEKPEKKSRTLKMRR